jgi:DNA recombination protein RmuC
VLGIILGLSIVAVLTLAVVAYKVMRGTPKAAELAKLRAETESQQKEIVELRAKTEQANALLADKARLEAELAGERKSAGEKLALLEDAETRLKKEFENLAGRILGEKGEELSKQQRERLSDLLQPFKEQLEAFRKRVDDVHKDEVERNATLLEQIRQLQETSNKVSDDANNLACALRGDAKKIGDWGELVIERVFQASGLAEGREYLKQESLRDNQGKLRKPDYIVYLPGDKAAVVDSKLSLADYERYASADKPEVQQAALSAHVEAVRKHILELSDKDYAQLLGNRTLDFVIMCIPNEPAYSLVMQADRDLIYDLAGMKVVVTGPTMLMVTLKVIAQIWRREHENRNAEEIAKRAGWLYDQVVLISESMLDAQKKLSAVGESFDTALRRLKDGRGNLVARVEQLRALGAKAGKQFPSGVIRDALAGEPGLSGDVANRQPEAEAGSSVS